MRGMKKRMNKGGLTGGQKSLDKNKDGRISGEDFKLMKAKGGSVKKRVKKKKKPTKKRAKAMGGGMMKKRMKRGGKA